MTNRQKQDIPGEIRPTDNLYMMIKDINSARASRAAINATFTTLSRRLLAEPWLPLDTTVNPSQVGLSTQRIHVFLYHSHSQSPRAEQHQCCACTRQPPCHSSVNALVNPPLLNAGV
jgi:hypothetical protein